MAKAKTPPHKVVMTEGKEELSIANCLEIQVKTHYTQAMSYDRDLRLRALEYAKEHGNQFLNHICLLSVY